MKKKIRSLILFNSIFYVFILLHKFYTDDNVPQVIFYMFLSFSSILLEEVFRNKINELKLGVSIDFIIRLIVLIIHFITLISGINIKLSCIIISMFWIVNTIIELILLKSNNMQERDIENINKKEVNKFIEDFISKKIDYLLIGINFAEEIKLIINALIASGKSNILIIVISILVFISRFIYENFPQFIFIPILIIIPLIYILSNLTYKMNEAIYEDYNYKIKKSRIDNVTFTIGYIILFVYSVFLYDKLGYFNISTLVFGTLFWIPIFNTKNKLKKKIENAYRKYNKL